LELSQTVEKPASLGFFDNKRKKDAAAAAALEETGGRNEFRHPLKYDLFFLFAGGEKLFCRRSAERATETSL
jgi:hypothetical protein